MTSITSISERIVTGVSETAVQATPRLLPAAVVLIVSALGIRLVMGRIDDSLALFVSNKRNASVARKGVKAALWLVTVLIVLSILGYQQVATALGTASGLIAVGVSYAAKDAIRQSIAGLYLMEDEEFIVGATVSASGVSGEIVGISLQRTKIRNEGGDVTTVSNQKIEPKWTIVSESGNANRK